MGPRTTSWIVLAFAACGPMYGPPAGQQQPPPQQAQSGPPGANGGDWSEPAPQPSGPSDPYSAESPAPEPPPRQDPPLAPTPDPWATNNPPEPPPRPAPPSRPEPAPEPPPAPEPTGLSKDAAQILSAHNRYRGDHCAAPLTWSPKLEQVAQAWANSLKNDGCKFGHSGSKYGENLAAGTSGTLDGNAVAAMWYDEIKLYDFNRGGFSMETGHFTQVVWRNSKQIGCGKATCRGMDIWVCNYDPPGNFDRGYRDNVKPKGCK